MKIQSGEVDHIPASLRTPEFRRLLDQCIHCGMCLQACPTYAVFGTEMDSPRGRIALMRAAAEGRLELLGALRRHIAVCLSCRSCETACPSGVRYGELVDSVRVAIEAARSPGRGERILRQAALRELLPHIRRLRLLAGALRLYQAVGLSRLVRGLGLLPRRLRVMESLLPPLGRRAGPRASPAEAGSRGPVVGFFHGCVQEAFLSAVNAATVRVLERNGFTVGTPAGQTCCGAAALHLGEEELCRELARQNIEAFEGQDCDLVVNNAGGCGAMLKEYPRLLADDPRYAERARRFAAKVRDISELLAERLSRPPGGSLPARVTYVDSCHLRHAQKIVRQPRDLLRMIPDLELVELRQPDRCCGSAGVYNILEVETADAVLDAKMADIAGTGAQMIVTTNAGCYMQLVRGVRRAGLRAEVVHLIELLDRSYAAQEVLGQGARNAGSER